MAEPAEPGLPFKGYGPIRPFAISTRTEPAARALHRPASRPAASPTRPQALPLGVTPSRVRATRITEAPDRKRSIEAVQVFGCSRPLMRKIYNQREPHR